MSGEEPRAPVARAWFEQLRDRICASFEAIEDAYGGAADADLAPGRFERQPWDRPGGGGGVIAIMRGRVFEKVGVNVSTVWGEFSPEFRQQMPGAEADGRFWASGISRWHLRSPHAPPAHMNTPHSHQQAWFGGGADLNPIYPDEDDTAAFHARLQVACDGYAPDAYDRFKRWADEYFFIPHRGEARGVGGIFYDYLEGDLRAPPRLHPGRRRGLPRRLPAAGPPAHGPALDRGRAPASAGPARPLCRVQPDLRPRHPVRPQDRRQSEAILMSLPPAAAWP